VGSEGFWTKEGMAGGTIDRILGNASYMILLKRRGIRGRKRQAESPMGVNTKGVKKEWRLVWLQLKLRSWKTLP